MNIPRLLIPGVALVREGVYVFVCPICRKTFRYNDRYEPVCTGPSEMRDEHPMTVMRLIGREPRKVFV